MSSNEKCIICVEDDFTMQHVFRRMLETSPNRDESVQIHMTGSGQYGLSLCKKNPNALMFLDIQIPDITGPEIINGIKEVNNRPFIVMVSGITDKNVVEYMLKEGARGYIQKPFQQEEIDKYLAMYQREPIMSV